ncbi:MAG: Ni-sirohydrochlorin a,c-diamide reductive cyclase catalytic subunit [Euryarchaeota archaeon]|nr:Ni-sirohydrochlorin a,c-diamide reductive cyclase catalytic subunit [Euryarchaeota archaeon]
MVYQRGIPLNDILHPRPNPIIAAMYTLRDLDADVVLMHGPAGCGFMASRRLEEAGVHVMTTGMRESDLIFGAEEKLVRILRDIDDRFNPGLIGVVGTCASMIIGENLDGAIKKADVQATVLPIDIHGCSGPNTTGAIAVLDAAASYGLITQHERDRQKMLLEKATLIEKERGLTSKSYLKPHPGTTKLSAAQAIVGTLRKGGKISVVLNAKKETAYGFADIMRAVEHARSVVGGEVHYIGNLDDKVGLPRIRRYASNILRDLDDANVIIESITGGLDEYAVSGKKAAEALKQCDADLRIIAGLPHTVPDLSKNDVLVTDQARQIRNYLEKGFTIAVGELSTHADVMSTHTVLRSELGETIRQVADGGLA